MKKKLLVLLYALLIKNIAQSQIEHVIIITTDGFRWQELFSGVDTAIANNRRFNEGDSAIIYKRYWDADPLQSRKKLLPFIWNELVKNGSIYGNRNAGNKVNLANPYWISYPGYSEIFTGYPDPQVNSNGFKPNPNITLFDFLNTQSKFKNKMAAFGAWDAFNRILNRQRNGLPIFSAFDTVTGKLTAQQKLINQMLTNSYRPWGSGECFDVFTHYAAMEYLKAHQPKVLFIGYGETDEWAHNAQYRSYLDAAHQFDQWLDEIWQYVQSSPLYKNKTALFITTDHGRGDTIKSQWTSHGSSVKGADETWFMVIAPGLPAKGEVTTNGQYFTKQFAQTVAGLLGTTFKADHPIGEKIDLR
ncbi:sulfatase-like hydrolase/transferase [Niabella sp. CJ426]|jgi:hypothetical protein|uniref:sulfatase-like hydrolase/transferase n=1 Tax=Niabella sp. CJ426 TaxID=3393740 RepID=UPI003CFC0CEB